MHKSIIEQAQAELMQFRANHVVKKKPIVTATSNIVRDVDFLRESGSWSSKYNISDKLKKIVEAREREYEKQKTRSDYDIRRDVLEKYKSLIRPEAHEPFKKNTLQQTQALRAVRDWLKGDSQILILSGKTGCGKTLAAIDALCFIRGDLIEARDLSSRLNPWGDESASHEKINMNHSLLVLDDLGTEIRSTRFDSDLESFLSDRQGSNSKGPLRTIITTNVIPKIVRGQYGERIRDRFNGLTVEKIITEGSMR